MPSIQTLHILNKSPEHPRFEQCLGVLSPHDALLLIENGVVALASNALDARDNVFALTSDVSARGVSTDAGVVTLMDYAGMVELTLQAQRVINW